ncbi:MAG: SGNH/GDSL hydrolase family protein [Clostridia bacterium]|nr:SGNH/GDSL hydrolase family protein [Clostridia bacterium]
MKRVQTCESLVLIGTEWTQLRYRDILGNTAEVMMEDFAGISNSGCFAEVMFEGVTRRSFVPGRDYELDEKNGRIRRTPNSTMPDYTNSVFYGKEVFNHEEYNGRWGNYPYMVYISYIYESSDNQLVEDDARHIACQWNGPRPERTLRRLMAGESLNYLVYGDSISTGCEALYLKDTYFARFADRLQRVTGGTVNICNASIGGETSREGVARFEAALQTHDPDLVSIAYGMNDMCVKPGRPTDLTVEQYTDNIRTMLNMARAHGAEVILITNCLPNPRWCYTSAAHKEFAVGLRKLAKEEQVPLADVQALWERELAHGKTLSDLLLNDVNHPTSYGHYLYAAMLETLI